ncbi:hypothetical protein KP509_08G003800 [Ceratopteris richardii]|uniref:Uncharacterized protein n=1 Tax=Ceratopteris richardii TaxID=49495 RepID=A0A8T2UB78_CERRI|nr:hypothetical protein KP509_08G003800 [Ceratopteris richardii]KAH7430551.1 hypothetical protein KP509_08G003800 [Ceratopteris richardii]KAH7430554.1 hypothetical protein KP509_08G003800 [Ceratopteris richardii]
MSAFLDQAFLIDVSEEDDSLLLAGGEGSHKSVDDSARSSVQEDCNAEEVINKDCNAEDCDAEEVTNKDKCPLSQPGSVTEMPVKLASPGTFEDPSVMKKKKKKSGFNVRKSMAWNSAFFTEEGVLDTEELSLVNKTFKKCTGLERQSILKKPIPTSRLIKPPLMPKIRVMSNELVVNTESKEKLLTPASSDCSENIEDFSESHNSYNIGPDEISSSSSTGGLIRSSKEKPSLSANIDSKARPSLIRRSIEKIEQAAAVAAKSITESKHPVKVERPAVNIETRRHSAFMKPTTAAACSSKLESDVSASKACPLSRSSSLSEGFRSSTGRDKPTGLRMPSPKMGFFEMSRTQVPVLRERTNGHSSSGPSPENSSTGHLNMEKNSVSKSNMSQLQQIACAKFGHQPSEVSKNQTRGVRTSTRIPMVTQAHGKARQVEFATQQSSKKALHLPNATLNTEQVLQVRKNGHNAVLKNQTNKEQQGACKVKGQENWCPNPIESTCLTQKFPTSKDLAVLRASTESEL